MIYLDNAATTIHKPRQVIDAVAAAMTSFGNSSRGTHQGSLDASRTVYQAREKLAKLFGCPRADHVIFTSNSTEALNIALNGLFVPGDHIISTDLEHNSVLRPLYRLEQEENVRVDFVTADSRGIPDMGQFESLLCPETKAIVCTHASNVTGFVMDVRRIGEIAKKHGLLFLVDASQTAGVFPINMEEMNIDVLCFTGHKGLMGPQGTGGLCIRPGVEIRPWKTGGTGIRTYDHEQPQGYPTRLEAGTLNGHGIAGLSAAIDYIEKTGMDRIREKEQLLARRFRDGVRPISGVRLYGEVANSYGCEAPVQRCDEESAPIVSLNIRDYDSGSVADELSEEYGIAVRPGGHCAPRLHEALGTVEQGMVRFSFSWFNTEEEVDAAIEAVRRIAE